MEAEVGQALEVEESWWLVVFWTGRQGGPGGSRIGRKGLCLWVWWTWLQDVEDVACRAHVL